MLTPVKEEAFITLTMKNFPIWIQNKGKEDQILNTCYWQIPASTFSSSTVILSSLAVLVREMVTLSTVHETHTSSEKICMLFIVLHKEFWTCFSTICTTCSNIRYLCLSGLKLFYPGLIAAVVYVVISSLLKLVKSSLLI